MEEECIKNKPLPFESTTISVDMKNNLTYYQHKTDSHNHWKFKLLRKQYGWAGEGKFWALNNEIALCDNCLMDISDEGRKTSLAIDLDFTVEELDEFLAFLTDKCKLIKITGDGITTDTTQENLQRVIEDRERKRTWVKEKRDGQKTSTEELHDVDNSHVDVEKGHVDVDNRQSKGKESKVKEDTTKGESIKGSNKANASGEAGASPVSDQELKLQYKSLAADPVKVEAFVQQHRPAFAEPYALLWNLFAKEKNFPQVREITNERRRKIKTRAAEKSFDIIGILNKARASPGLKNHWFSFDWIIKNQSNYTKVLEGNYGAPKTEYNGSHQQTPAVKSAAKSAGANQLLGMLHADLHAISGGAQGG